MLASKRSLDSKTHGKSRLSCVFGLRILATSLFFCSHRRVVGISERTEGKKRRHLNLLKETLCFMDLCKLNTTVAEQEKLFFGVFFTAHYDSPRRAQCLAGILNEWWWTKWTVCNQMLTMCLPKGKYSSNVLLVSYPPTLFLLSRAGYLPQNVPLQMISYLSQESEFLPWHAASRALYQLDKLLDRTEDHSLFSVSLISHQFGVCWILTLTSVIRKTQLISSSTSQVTRQIELKTSSDHYSTTVHNVSGTMPVLETVRFPPLFVF